jgi:hypothetical protein
MEDVEHQPRSVDVICGIAMKRDLRDNGRLARLVELGCAERGGDPDPWQSIAELNVVARLPVL